MKQIQTPDLLLEIQRRACNFFWQKADPNTGLINDRAKNKGSDEYDVASIASTGYGLAALPIAVRRGWQTHQAAYDRALQTLRFLRHEIPHQRGWYFHFITKSSGERVWNCELSSIDTALLIIGSLICGQFFDNTEVQRLANELYERLDWHWMLTNNGQQPEKQLLAHGWKPESGFLPYNWDRYCEHTFLYLIGMGALSKALPAQCWNEWQRPIIEYKEYRTLTGGPIFMHQMAHGFYNFKDQCDNKGWNYWVSSTHATVINRQFCIDNASRRKTYSDTIWGLNACDFPGGYTAFSAPGNEDGTVSPTGAIASILFTPELSIASAKSMYSNYGEKIWGDFGFSNAFNVDQDWYDTDVIGIDLGMVLLNIENASTGLIWKLLQSHPSTPKAWAAAGFYDTDKPDALNCRFEE